MHLNLLFFSVVTTTIALFDDTLYRCIQWSKAIAVAAKKLEGFVLGKTTIAAQSWLSGFHYKSKRAVGGGGGGLSGTVHGPK